MDQKQLDEMMVKALVVKINEGVELLKQAGFNENAIYGYLQNATDKVLGSAKQALWETVIK